MPTSCTLGIVRLRAGRVDVVGLISVRDENWSLEGTPGGSQVCLSGFRVNITNHAASSNWQIGSASGPSDQQVGTRVSAIRANCCGAVFLQSPPNGRPVSLLKTHGDPPMAPSRSHPSLLVTTNSLCPVSRTWPWHLLLNSSMAEPTSSKNILQGDKNKDHRVSHRRKTNFHVYSNIIFNV